MNLTVLAVTFGILALLSIGVIYALWPSKPSGEHPNSARLKTFATYNPTFKYLGVEMQAARIAYRHMYGGRPIPYLMADYVDKNGVLREACWYPTDIDTLESTAEAWWTPENATPAAS